MSIHDTESDERALRQAIAAIPAGRWAVGVSGGADSVALLHLLRDRTDLHLHIVHLNHQTRGTESDADAAFVAQLATDANLPVTIAKIDSIDLKPITNPSARFRAARLALFARAIEAHNLAGVLLAHHADDQAETILQRLLRGAGPSGLAGMQAVARVGGITVRHPLLLIRREALRAVLRRRKISWREDASNASDKYLRNRLRELLRDREELRAALLDLATSCAALRSWADANAPQLSATFPAVQLAALPEILADRAARRWFRERGVNDISPQSVNRLLTMARDMASPPRAHFPGGLLVRRKKGMISA